MEERNWLALQFEENRTHLKKVALRMLGSANEAEDAVQEAWLRLSSSQSDTIANLTGWLTTVVARICMDVLRSRKARHEERLSTDGLAQIEDVGAVDPESEAILADSIGPALLIVLDMLSPAERVAFVLHDMFGMPFEEIALVIDRSLTSSRQLASRARRRVRGSSDDAESSGGIRHSREGEEKQRNERRIVDAFLSAARNGDFEALVAVLDPNCIFRADTIASNLWSPQQIKGSSGVAEFFRGNAVGVHPALINGIIAAAWAPGGRVRATFNFTFSDGKIVGIEVISDPIRLDQLNVVLLDR